MDIKTFKKQCCSFFTALLTVVLVGAASTGYAANLELEESDSIGGNIENDGGTDWEDLFNPGNVNTPPSEKGALPADYSTSVFVRDFKPGSSGPDASTFATGSKDTLNITPGWECSRDNNVNDKTDVVNAYATAYTDPGSGDLIVYFALERYSNEGTGNVAFWFLKDDTVACVLPDQGNPKSDSFTGNHMDGDTLIVAEFAKGGDLDNLSIVAYRWVGGAGGFLDPTPIVADSECNGDGAGQNLCGVVNKQPILFPGGIPWHTETKQNGPGYSNDLEPGLFFEGKINLTQLGLQGCFSKYMGVTRSSVSLTATLFDFALGDFNLCSIDVTKACTVGIDAVANAAGTQVITPFSVTVTNDGAGPVYDVSIAEKLAPEIASCKLISVDGDTTGLPVALTQNSPYEIKASLASGASTVARVDCEGANGLLNIVDASAASVDGGSKDTTDSYTMLFNQGCPININPAVTLTKVCDDVDLYIDSSSSILTMLVNVNISVKNNSIEKLLNVDLDNQVGALPNAGSAIQLIYTDSSYNYTEADGVTASAVPVVYNSDAASQFELAPNETRYFRSEYNPADVDGGVATDDSPGAAMFTDTIDVTGRGAISGTFIENSGPVYISQTCPLCPPEEP